MQKKNPTSSGHRKNLSPPANFRHRVLGEGMLELGFEDAARRTFEIARKARKRPNFISVYGKPNSGKSYFMENIVRMLSAHGIGAVSFGSWPERSIFELIKKRETYETADLFILHCADVRRNLPDYPDVSVREIFGKSQLLNIGIYNPAFSLFPCGDYDFVVRNPDSTFKTIREELTFNGGVAEITRRAAGLIMPNSPFYFSMYGLPNSGKTKLAERLSGSLVQLGYWPKILSSDEKSARESISYARENPNSLFLFDCATPRRLSGDECSQDPGALTLGIGKEISLKIGIYNPKLHEPIPGYYDVVIRNPESSVKK